MKKMTKRIKLIALLLCIGIVSCNDIKRTDTNATKDVVSDTTNKITTGNNSQNSLDWVGTYEGTIPCADCEGIETIITLNGDGTFTESDTYLKKGERQVFKNDGKFEWDKTGSIITLKSTSESHQYKVGENKLIGLDMDGKEITGQLADKYILKKSN